MEQLQLFKTSVEFPDRVMPPLVVDHNKLKVRGTLPVSNGSQSDRLSLTPGGMFGFAVFLQALLNRAVDRTEGTEVEPLEKLYALLAQCIYRHRDNHNKTALLQVRRPEAEQRFLWPPDVCHTSCLCDSTSPFVFNGLVSQLEIIL